jgi:N6-L-threonylcarbamoyladenine synthase
LEDGRTVVAIIVSVQDEVDVHFGVVVPELESRQHFKFVVPIVDSALRKAGATLKDVDGMAVTYGPGLVGSLLVGLSLVKGMSFRTGIPYVGINHLEAHLLAIHLEHEVTFPYIALLASGGHTLLYSVRGVGDYVHLGGTRDDAAGEAYDKVAKMMGLGYPGGRVIDQLAQSGNPRAIRFPRAKIKSSAYEFSFSGIKTAVWHYLQFHPEAQAQERSADIAASFQEAVTDMLVCPAINAARAHAVERIVLSGGVAANSRLRSKMKEQADAAGISVFYPAPKFCTDNGAMIALAGYHWLKRGRRDDFALNADADLTL